MPQSIGETATNDLFRALASQDRRRLLFALTERPPQGEVPVPEVVDGGECTLDLLRQRFHHNHLPTLETLELITWNREDDMVSRGPHFDDVRPMLDILDELRDELPDGLV